MPGNDVVHLTHSNYNQQQWRDYGVNVEVGSIDTLEFVLCAKRGP